MKGHEITNEVEIYGVEYIFDDLPEEQQREIAANIQDGIMASAGYRRRNTA